MLHCDACDTIALPQITNKVRTARTPAHASPGMKRCVRECREWSEMRLLTRLRHGTVTPWRTASICRLSVRCTWCSLTKLVTAAVCFFWLLGQCVVVVAATGCRKQEGVWCVSKVTVSAF